jgi:hypothetical protein
MKRRNFVRSQESGSTAQDNEDIPSSRPSRRRLSALELSGILEETAPASSSLITGAAQDASAMNDGGSGCEDAARSERRSPELAPDRAPDSPVDSEEDREARILREEERGFFL